MMHSYMTIFFSHWHVNGEFHACRACTYFPVTDFA
jgi:hypothetical protein